MLRPRTLGLAAVLAAGCQADRVHLPAGALPPPAPPADAVAAARLDVPPTESPVVVASASLPADGRPLTLAELQAFALANSPVVRRARADADAAYGLVVQAGLHPNPTVGYQADQWQPGFPTAGQQGGFVNQLVKTAGKLRLAQLVAGFDYLNALVAVRRAEVDVTAAVRSAYFTVLVSKLSAETNAALARQADEAVALQQARVAAKEAADYEPLALRAQAVVARNAGVAAEARYRAGWRQLAAALGRPDLPFGAVAGRADAPPPGWEADALRTATLDRHTDVLTARNAQSQAVADLELQRRQPVPDLQTNTYQQFDNLTRQYQFGVQVGVQLPVSDRNQGNVRHAQARVGRAAEHMEAVRNEVSARLAEAAGRLDADRAVAANLRDRVLPDLTRAYRGTLAAYQLTPERVTFTDVVVAQQLVAAQTQAYLAALAGQWQAVADLAQAAQVDDLYQP